MSRFALPFISAFLLSQLFVLAESQEEEIARIFADIGKLPPEPQGPELDRNRGSYVFEAEDGTYDKGGHFGRWNWPEYTGERWGMYDVEITYASVGAQMGVQFYVGDVKAKGHVPQSGSMDDVNVAILDRIYIPDTKTHRVGMLTGEDSNGPSFKLYKVTLRPAPEGDRVSQEIDSSITLEAKTATTFSRKMRYEPNPKKNCLGFWADEKDWAQWRVSVHDGGKFDLEIYQGCGGGNGGSEVAVWINQEQAKFTVEDTGGFQNWKAVKLGTFELATGDHLITVKPLNKTGKAVMDVHKITLNPATS